MVVDEGYRRILAQYDTPIPRGSIATLAIGCPQCLGYMQLADCERVEHEHDSVFCVHCWHKLELPRR